MKLTEAPSNKLTRGLIAIMVVIIVAIYYFSELRPFEYEGYEKNISEFQRYNAELNAATVEARSGVTKQYAPIDNALEGVHSVLNIFKNDLRLHPDPLIAKRLATLESSVNQKDHFAQEFKKYNPILTNATYQFSNIIGQMLEEEANTKLIESSLGQASTQAFRQSIVDKISALFREILTYINFRTEDRHQKLVAMVKELRKDLALLPADAEKFPKIDQGLAYADTILTLQPQLETIEKGFFDVPIVPNLNTLNQTYKTAYLKYLDRSGKFRIVLYLMVFILLVLLWWAFARLQRTITNLIQAEHELAEINRQLEQRVADRTAELRERNQDLNKAMEDLKEAQDQLIMQEKMASVGMLTTGIAHEIKNPLNFVNNFADISVDLVSELSEELDKEKGKLGEEPLNYIKGIIDDLKTNCEKIKDHGVRADNIVKTMLMHSQEAGVQKEAIDVKNLMDESIKVSLESFKGTHPQFEPKVEESAEPMDKILAAPQTLGRTFMYILDNAFYAMDEKKKTATPGYQPIVNILIKPEGDNVVIKIKDNGTGIPKKFLDKVFEPFYTTKPTGKGNTGLGLSICYDTVVKQHKGDLRVVSEEGSFTEFTIVLPMKKS